ncbi:sensor histidine kinase [Paenibacillus thalictri]|uniref:Histidine kinase domain-containing protein n=1 Tax=Paenibacillus thalictri TaxID=2527873 RepID=A0A4Q9DY08_9BACL|nr:histidine kinase [Paenibacillus thalictri]TBL80763.1 hypothetical protein EYB31_05940 [Paenibacillus thalictri]
MDLNITKDFLLQLALITTLIFTFEIFFAEKSKIQHYAAIIQAVSWGLSILLCMSFPTYITSGIRVDIRIVPLLLGTLYGGWRTGVSLSALIILYRIYLGVDSGVYTTILTLLCSMAAIIYAQTFFAAAGKNKRLLLALLLSVCYCFVGGITRVWVDGFSFKFLQVQVIYTIISISSVLFFIYIKETVREITEKNRQLQAEARDAEIAFLRSQIKPHFLYNTLNSIAVLCIKDPRKAEELTLEFSQYLRKSFDFKQLDCLTTIENELELVKAYLNIEKVRFGARLFVEYDVTANPDTRIPPLILQPLVENAVRHGLMSNLRGGTVEISIRTEADGAVSFVIEDNGCGMSERQIEEILQSNASKKGVGLWNISQRLKLLYGKSIRIESAVGIGTKVIFNIPAYTAKQNGG